MYTSSLQSGSWRWNEPSPGWRVPKWYSPVSVFSGGLCLFKSILERWRQCFPAHLRPSRKRKDLPIKRQRGARGSKRLKSVFIQLHLWETWISPISWEPRLIWEFVYAVSVCWRRCLFLCPPHALQESAKSRMVFDDENSREEEHDVFSSVGANFSKSLTWRNFANVLWEGVRKTI